MATLAQDLTQDRLYVSSRDGQLEVRRLVTTHARRALDKLIREHGHEVVDTPLGRALADRAGRSGDATGVDAIRGDGRMLRDPATGRWRGAWYLQPKERR